MTTKQIIPATIISVILISYASLIPTAAQQQPQAETNQPQPPQPDKNIFIIVCDSHPNKIIILDADGKWIPTIKNATITYDLTTPTTQVNITCTTYEGTFAPSNPQKKHWQLNQLKSVNKADFQKMVDGLQNDPEAVRKTLVTP